MIGREEGKSGCASSGGGAEIYQAKTGYERDSF